MTEWVGVIKERKGLDAKKCLRKVKVAGVSVCEETLLLWVKSLNGWRQKKMQ